ncbi:hypothetical protein [Oceaniovalibus sp. ACAM 378]|nr:hypothetical protein [Oceaniovalibus sp. ACAM 378]
MSTNNATPWAKTGLYRAHTPTGWAVYCKAYGFARPATADEAKSQEVRDD